MADKKRPYDYEVERECVEWAIANDVFIGTALDELFETMERSDREKACRKRIQRIDDVKRTPITSEADENPEDFPELEEV